MYKVNNLEVKSKYLQFLKVLTNLRGKLTQTLEQRKTKVTGRDADARKSFFLKIFIFLTDKKHCALHLLLLHQFSVVNLGEQAQTQAQVKDRDNHACALFLLASLPSPV